MNERTQAQGRGSAWSVQVARVLDIPIRVHFTFLLLVIWFALSARAWGQTPLGAVFFLLLVFVCVALHELGHAAMAKRFGVRTHEIVLYPIGGIARLESMPGGRAELAIAIAGPAVLHTLIQGNALDRLYHTTAHCLLGGTRFDTFVWGAPLEPAFHMPLRAMYFDPYAPEGAGQTLAIYDR